MNVLFQRCKSSNFYNKYKKQENTAATHGVTQITHPSAFSAFSTSFNGSISPLIHMEHSDAQTLTKAHDHTTCRQAKLCK